MGPPLLIGACRGCFEFKTSGSVSATLVFFFGLPGEFFLVGLLKDED